MVPNNSHTLALFFKRIQQNKDEFSDTLLVRSCEDGSLFSRLPAIDALAARDSAAASQNIFLLHRNTAHGCASFFLNFFFALAGATPANERKSGFHRGLELVVIGGGAGIRTPEGQGFVV